MGIPPVYVGELLLLFSIFTTLGSGQLFALFTRPLGWLLACFLVWELSCTLPYLETYGIDAARDSVTWLYSLFAICLAAVVIRYAGSISVIVSFYARFGSAFVIVGTACAILYACIPDHLPTWPGTDVTFPNTKCPDLCVHLTGVICFLLVGFVEKKNWWLIPGLIAFLLGLSLSRGGGVSVIAGSFVILLLYPRSKRLFLVFSSIFLVVDVHMKVGDQRREVSSQQLVRNLASVLGEKSDENLDGTKEWRIEWWNRIIEYTIHGPYFWTGKGFGVNLTLADGMERNENEFLGLRSPHNSHLTFLARSGVPGFALWVWLQMAWLGTMLLAHYRARVSRQATWAALFAWILAYWLSFMVNAAFDVAFEGPVTGIPFWMLWGFGWGSSIIFTKQRFSSQDRLRRLAY